MVIDGEIRCKITGAGRKLEVLHGLSLLLSAPDAAETLPMPIGITAKRPAITNTLLAFIFITLSVFVIMIP